MMAAWSRIAALRASRGLGLAALVVANAVPLAGVLFLGWDVWSILILYWLENGVVGLFSVARLATVRERGGGPTVAERAARIPFFVVHYGIFWLVHGVFVFSLPQFLDDPGASAPSLGVEGMLLALIGLALSHLVSFWVNWLRGGERDRTTLDAQFTAPYQRVMVLHLTIIFGAAGVAMAGQPAVLVALLVVIKAALDATLYLRSHRPVR